MGEKFGAEEGTYGPLLLRAKKIKIGL